MMKPNRSSDRSVSANSLFSTELSDLLAAEISGGTSIALEATASTTAGESSSAVVSSITATGTELSLNTPISLGKGFAEAIGSESVTTMEALGKNAKAIEYFHSHRFKCRELRFVKEFFSFIHRY